MRARQFTYEMISAPSQGNEPAGMELEVDPTPAAPVYADSNQIKQVLALLTQSLPQGKFSQQNAAGAKRVRSVRAKGISLADLKSAMANWGATLGSPDANQSTASSSFPANSFEKDGVLYTVVIGMKGQASGDETSTGISRKELTPAGLGIAGGSYNKQDLIDITKQAVATKFGQRDPALADALSALVDNAASGGNTPLSAEQAAAIAPTLGTISQDFGEILAPILIMKPEDQAELPTGNNPLVDVKLPGMNMSVKALTGSGTSFRSIQNLMDKYEASITDNKDTAKQEKYSILKQFHPGTGGNNKDKIIRAAAAANTAEYTSLIDILGVTELTSFNDIATGVQSLTGSKDYASFLSTFYPMMIAGPWGKPVGLPADGAFTMGLDKSKVKKEKAAGKPSYVANPVSGGADILTYALGVGLLNYIKKGENAADYQEMMTDIVKHADAVIGHIAINPNGTLKLTTRPFSELKFAFQYHAPSHIPGNNLPGFIAIL